MTVNLAATDAGSGVRSDWYQNNGTATYNDGTHGVLPLYTWGPAIWYSVDGGPYVEGTSPTVSGEGHTISYYSKDNAGNQSATQTFTPPDRHHRPGGHRQ